MKNIMLVFGTRPEAIKMCPLVNELKQRDGVNVTVCVTGQHRQMLDQVLDAFNVEPDYDLSIMKSKQTLFDITTIFSMGFKLFWKRCGLTWCLSTVIHPPHLLQHWLVSIYRFLWDM